MRVRLSDSALSAHVSFCRVEALAARSDADQAHRPAQQLYAPV